MILSLYLHQLNSVVEPYDIIHHILGIKIKDLCILVGSRAGSRCDEEPISLYILYTSGHSACDGRLPQVEPFKPWSIGKGLHKNQFHMISMKNLMRIITVWWICTGSTWCSTSILQTSKWLLQDIHMKDPKVNTTSCKSCSILYDTHTTLCNTRMSVAWCCTKPWYEHHMISPLGINGMPGFRDLLISHCCWRPQHAD